MPEALDTKDMENVIRQSPAQFSAGLEAARGVAVDRKVTRILLAGMGGSWMAGPLMREAGLTRSVIQIHRDYGLRDGVDLADTLVLASSFSGNTEETLSAYKAAKDLGLALIGISTGGELARRCRDDKIPHVKIPTDTSVMQPRSATGYSVGILAQLLANHGLAGSDAIRGIQALESTLSGFMNTARERGRLLVSALSRATPVIYASEKYATVAQIFKIKINENAKTPAFWNVCPEMNHNEMVGWTQCRGPFHIVFLRDPGDDSQVLRRMSITQEIFASCGISSSVVPIEGTSRVEKVFTTLVIGDWASYELALALGVDPSPVKMVEDLKDRLRRQGE